MPTDAEKIEHIKQLNRERQKRYYEKNKAKICEKKIKDRADLKKCREEKQAVQQTPPEPSPPVIVKRIVKINKKTGKMIGRRPIYDEAFIVNFLEKNIEKIANRKTMISNTKILFRLTECNDLGICLQKPEKLISEIENGEQTRKEGKYTVNSKKSLYYLINFLIQKLEIPLSNEIKNRYKNLLEEYKIESDNERLQRQANNEFSVMPYNEYMKKVLDAYGENSKQYLVVCMYNELTVRDDFQLEIIRTKAEAVDKNKNYMIVPRGKGVITFYIQEYKTSQRYGTIDFKTSPGLTRLLKNYMESKNLTYGDQLFPKLSDFICKMNKDIGVEKGGVNFIRQSKITQEIFKNKISPAERVQLANLMRHSPVSQLKYVRLMKVTVE